MDRQQLIALGVGRGSPRDPLLGRAFLRRANLLQRPDEVFDDPVVLERATAFRDRLLAKESSQPGPTRDDLLAALAAARQATTPAASPH